MRKFLYIIILCFFVCLQTYVSAAVLISATTSKTSVVQAATTTPVVKPIVKNVYKDFKLKVPFFKQPYANSCEATSLRMALGYKGIVKNEIQILTQFTYNPRVKDWVKNIWDDPQKQYVGHVDVSGRPNGGYGVYGLPVIKAVESFGKVGVYATGTAITAEFLATEIDAKNPVLIWGYTSLREPPYTWKTDEGVEVKAVRGEHVRVVVGYKGTIEKPLGFYVHDPFYGKSFEYWSAKKLIDHIQKVPGVTDQAVVVR